ncbi:MAG: hypothetical protein AAGI07_03905, partial [Bacteroidota bacterium]
MKLSLLVPVLFLFLHNCTTDTRTNLKNIQTNDLVLPNPFIDKDGKHITSLKDWKKHRVYLKDLLAKYQYGEMPPTDLLDTV